MLYDMLEIVTEYDTMYSHLMNATHAKLGTFYIRTKFGPFSQMADQCRTAEYLRMLYIFFVIAKHSCTFKHCFWCSRIFINKQSLGGPGVSRSVIIITKNGKKIIATVTRFDNTCIKLLISQVSDLAVALGNLKRNVKEELFES